MLTSVRAGRLSGHCCQLTCSMCLPGTARRSVTVRAATGAGSRYSSNGTSRRGKSKVPLDFDSTLKDMAIGPMPPPPEPSLSDLEKEGLLSKDGGTPEWIKAMQEAAEQGDPEYQKVLAGTDNDPIKVMRNINKAVEKRRDEILNPEHIPDAEAGKKMRVRFRDVSHFNLWIWVKLADTPRAREQELVKEVFKSWYTMGRLSAFNGMNLQVFYHGAGETSHMDYDQEELESGLTASFHEMSEPQFNGKWCRVWLDLGTADEFALDMLINAFSGFSREHCVVTDLIIGGENEDWPVPEIKIQDGTVSAGIPAGVDMSKFGIGGDPDEKTGYEIEEMDEITDIDAYLNGKDDEFGI